MVRYLLGAGLALALAAPVGAASTVEWVGQVALPATLRVGDSEVGGLSGLDYDPRRDLWYLISDEHSATGAARAYSARLGLNGDGYTLAIDALLPLTDCRSRRFVPLSMEGPVADAESVRVDPRGGLVWSSEGVYTRGIGPSVTFADPHGVCTGELPLPSMLQRDPSGRSGPRSNKAFEGLAFAEDGESLWLSVEDALLQDGPVSSLEQGGLARITQLDRRGHILKQFAYNLDPIQAPGVGGVADNGISEILDDGEGLLVLERSGAKNAQGHFDFRCRLYRVAFDDATDVARIGDLRETTVRPLAKTLVFDFGQVPALRAYNFEGMAWGPRLADGRRLLVLVSDNGFESLDSRVVLLAVP